MCLLGVSNIVVAPLGCATKCLSFKAIGKKDRKEWELEAPVLLAARHSPLFYLLLSFRGKCVIVMAKLRT